MPPLFAISPSSFLRSRTSNHYNYHSDPATATPDSNPNPDANPTTTTNAATPLGTPPSSPTQRPSSPSRRSPVLAALSRRRTLPVKITLPRLTLPHSTGNHHPTAPIPSFPRPLRRSRSPNPRNPPKPPAGAPNPSANNLQPTTHPPPATLPSPTPTPYVPPSERELLVLVHGLQGAVGDFSYLLSTLRATKAHQSGNLILHAPTVNTDRTHDGISTGAHRLAVDIRAVITSHARRGQPLHRISLLGFSLGGLYVRYVAALLYDGRERGTIAGLKASSLILVASPHLGVRKFGYYRFVPEAVLSAPVFGETVREILLADDDGIMMRMTEDLDEEEESGDESDDGTSVSSSASSSTSRRLSQESGEWNCEVGEGEGEERRGRRRRHRLPFVKALETFEERILYANLRNDFMVNYGTAALDASVTAVTGEEVDRVVRERAASAVDEAYDEKGCRICFRFWMDAENGAPVDSRGVWRGGEGGDDGGSGGGVGIGTGLVRRRRTIGVMERISGWKFDWEGDEEEEGVGGGGVDGEEEHIMARRLRRVGWWVVGVDFPLALPIAHNRIVAMSRNAIHAWMNAPGKRVVHHVVDVIGQRFDGHVSLFRTTMGGSGIAGVGGVVSADVTAWL